MRRFARFYGADPLHLLAVLFTFALAGYAVAVVGPQNLWNQDVWWKSIAVWFLGAVIAHDLVLFPLYALADRSLTSGLNAMRGRRPPRPQSVSALNYIRVPTLASGLTLLLFLPGIIEQGADAYLAATGLTQEPFLDRWLLLTATFFAVSAVAYATRLALSRTDGGTVSGS
ncbi:hypothetical protein AXA44_33420 [Rhodococcus sp. SC4]|uniref:hypothetical protein n=1 Tax=unclassified Rhodococcus (in: high G+C Gram-positive bacteria) TaxID=192944 RepID=UPI00076ADF99|nr:MULTISPECIES: hypothetical protein [unclassified Rhodococcus (in: high G+C Gram-positive bacteria)]KXF56655.1 hypothetical protein AXA44_33420 [Rhodococcus sp. SC4]KXX57508.1 hypothetical protein AZG88_09610 [Rhodococcus sp. LB1]PBC55017.1 hypothetical protein CJ177_18620 [Rhodococcus sp. ACPA1]